MGVYRLSESKELAIHTWVSSTLGITTIWDKPDALRPALPYATLNFSSGPRSTGKSEIRYKQEDTFEYTFRKVITLTINIYSENAYLEYISTLINSLELDTVQEILRVAGLAIWGNSDPVDISRLLDTKHEFRASVDIFLAYATEADDVPGEILTVSVDGSLGDLLPEFTQSIEIYASRMGSASLTILDDDVYFIDNQQDFTDYLTAEGERQYIIIFVDTEGRRAFAYIGEEKELAYPYLSVTDFWSNTVYQFDQDGEILAIWDDFASNDDAYLTGIAIDDSGNIIVSDGTVYAEGEEQDTIRKFDSEGNFLTSWGLYGDEEGECGEPWGVVIDGDNNIPIADTGNNRIQKFDSGGEFISSFGSYGESGEGKFDLPYDLDTDIDGNTYVADTDNHRIQKFDSEGNFLLQWGLEGSGDGEFEWPYGIAVDRITGHVYVADRYNYRIQKFDSDGNFLLKWGYYGTGNGQFDEPSDITIDNDSKVYVVDTYNIRIQVFDSEGNYLSQWTIIDDPDAECQRIAIGYGIGAGGDEVRGIILYTDSDGSTQGLAGQDDGFDSDNIKNYVVVAISAP